MKKTYKYRWLVVCDGETTAFRTRAAAREARAFLFRHPTNANIRTFGPYGNVWGMPRVIDLPSLWRDGGAPYVYDDEDEWGGA